MRYADKRAEEHNKIMITVGWATIKNHSSALSLIASFSVYPLEFFSAYFCFDPHFFAERDTALISEE